MTVPEPTIDVLGTVWAGQSGPVEQVDGQLWIPGAWEAFVANLEDGTGPHPWWYERGMSDRLIRLMAAQDHADDADTDTDDDEDGWF